MQHEYKIVEVNVTDVTLDTRGPRVGRHGWSPALIGTACLDIVELGLDERHLTAEVRWEWCREDRRPHTTLWSTGHSLLRPMGCRGALVSAVGGLDDAVARLLTALSSGVVVPV